MNPIRVIPWQHEITRQSHRDIIAFLSTIRSGTHLGLEISQAEKQAYVLALREPAFLKEKILRLPREQLVQILSGIEVLHICIERGIQIHPLESERAMKIIQRANAKRTTMTPRDEMRDYALRENGMLEEFKSATRKGSVSIPYILTSPMHASNLIHILTRRGLRAILFVKPFSNPKNMHTICESVHLRRKALREGKEREYEAAGKKIQEAVRRDRTFPLRTVQPKLVAQIVSRPFVPAKPRKRRRTQR